MTRWAIMLGLAASGCHRESDTYEGTYGGYIRDAQLKDRVRLDRWESYLSLTLYKGEDGNAEGFLLLDGDVEIFVTPLVHFDIYDYGREPYPVSNLMLSLGEEDKTIKGKIRIPDFVIDVGFEGDFQPHYEWLSIDVNLLGQMRLFKVEPELALLTTGQTGSTGDTSADTGWGVITP